MNQPMNERKLEKLASQLPETVFIRFEAANSISAEEARSAGKELIKFLLLCSKSRASLAPSEIIDDLWHNFILHTRDYWRFCDDFIGEFIHHVPSEADSAGPYDLTRNLLIKEFGSVDPRFWPPRQVGARCSNCGSKCRG